MSSRGGQLALGLILAALAGCNSTTESGESRACPETFEFANSGCLEVSGQVVGLRDQPLAGIMVSPSYVKNGDAFGNSSAMTDANGAFRFRATRLAGLPPDVGPDTLSLWVVGAEPNTGTVGSPPPMRDSVLVQVSVSPVGDIPTTAVTRLTLPAP
jgi:hypothetical protein